MIQNWKRDLGIFWNFGKCHRGDPVVLQKPGLGSMSWEEHWVKELLLRSSLPGTLKRLRMLQSRFWTRRKFWSIKWSDRYNVLFSLALYLYFRLNELIFGLQKDILLSWLWVFLMLGWVWIIIVKWSCNDVICVSSCLLCCSVACKGCRVLGYIRVCLHTHEFFLWNLWCNWSRMLGIWRMESIFFMIWVLEVLDFSIEISKILAV